MTKYLAADLSALATLIPSMLIAMRRNGKPDAAYWAVLALAVIGPGVWVVTTISGSWQKGLSTSLWVTVAASMLLFSIVAIVSRQGWRLTPLLMPYMIGLGVLATIWQHTARIPLATDAPEGWIETHIIVSVTTYGLVTIAAIAALAALLQEKALKTKHPTSLSRMLPSVADSESILVRLLVVGELVLALGLATGMATQFMETGRIMVINHKTILSITSFVVIGGLLVAHFRSGVRGRLVTRFVLLAYLLLTLGYPGVKFVSEVLMS